MTLRTGTILLLFIALAAGLGSCRKSDLKGNRNGNKLPETHTIIKKIERSGADRFTSQLTLNWWGTDEDGYIVGYEFWFDNGNPVYTTRQDTVVLLQLPPGSDTADFTLYVRAIDNDGGRDESPASVSYPVKNSAPVASFTGLDNVPAKTFPALKFYFQASDPDGTDNLATYELVWNDTNQAPYLLSPVYTEILFVAEQVATTNPNLEVYPGPAKTPLALRAQGIVLNSMNTLYLRIIDKVNAKSNWIATPAIYVKKPASDLLLVNGYSSNPANALTFYSGNLSSIGISGFDTLATGGSVSELPQDNFAQGKIFNLFKKVLWFCDPATVPANLTIAQRALDQFFSNGGRLFLVAPFLGTVDPQATYLDFTPIKQFYSPPSGNFAMNNGANVSPIASSGWPTLKTTGIVNTARPFEIAGSFGNFAFSPIYSGEIVYVSGGLQTWDNTAPKDSSYLIARRIDVPNNRTNFILSTVELQKLNGNTNLDQFFTKVLKDELSF